MTSKTLARYAIREASGLIGMAAALFWSAGRLDWWQGWAALAVMAAWIAATAWVIVLSNPDLLAERLGPRRGAKTWDVVILSLLGLLQLARYIVAGLDQRYPWTGEVSLAAQLVALAIGGLGYALVVWATASNRFFSQIVRIQVERGQVVATRGPYRFLRHPAYAGAILFEIAVPILLGSLWALALSGVTVVLLVLRTLPKTDTAARAPCTRRMAQCAPADTRLASLGNTRTKGGDARLLVAGVSLRARCAPTPSPPTSLRRVGRPPLPEGSGMSIRLQLPRCHSGSTLARRRRLPVGRHRSRPAARRHGPGPPPPLKRYAVTGCWDQEAETIAVAKERRKKTAYGTSSNSPALIMPACRFHAKIHVHRREHAAMRRPRTWLELGYDAADFGTGRTGYWRAHQRRVAGYLPFGCRFRRRCTWFHVWAHAAVRVAIQTERVWVSMRDALPVNAEFDITPEWLSRIVLGPHLRALRAWSLEHPQVQLLAGHMWAGSFATAGQAA
jgi:protein-S-isoprenylcysteine O-methyltransferase Ste14